MQLRNSRAYRLLSKLISPLLTFFYAAPTVDSDFKSVPMILNIDTLESDWKWYQPHFVESSFSDSGLVLTCLSESVWYQNLRGPMVYRNIQGDCVVSVNVKTRKSSDVNSYPDSQWQFGGVIFRDPAGDTLLSRENYVFNVVGFRGTALQIETKSTRNGYSDVSAFDWESGDAEIRVEKRGCEFILNAKPIGAVDWLEMCRYTRPDLPEVLQMGLIVYAYSEGRELFDLQVEFSKFSLV